MCKNTFFSICLMASVGLFIVSESLLVASDADNCTCREITTGEIVAGLVVIGTTTTLAVLAAPYAITVAAPYVGAAATQAAAYVTSITTAGKISWGITAVKYARPHVVQTIEEKVNKLLAEKNLRRAKAKEKFVECLKSNRRSYPRNKAGIPIVCEEAALFYAIDSSVPELHKRTQAFKNNTCFCCN